MNNYKLDSIPNPSKDLLDIYRKQSEDIRVENLLNINPQNKARIGIKEKYKKYRLSNFFTRFITIIYILSLIIVLFAISENILTEDINAYLVAGLSFIALWIAICLLGMILSRYQSRLFEGLLFHSITYIYAFVMGYHYFIYGDLWGALLLFSVIIIFYSLIYYLRYKHD